MRSSKSPLKLIFRQRFQFLLEVLITFIGILIFMLIPVYLIPLFVDISSAFYEPIVYVVRAIVLIASITLFSYLASFITDSQKKRIILEEDLSPARKFLKLFNISKNNFKYQFLYGILILFLVFIPLDFVTYLIPGMLNYSTQLLNPTNQYSLNSYLLENYFTFLISVIVIQISVAIFEEGLTRGFLANRGTDYVQKMSAVMISSFFFGLGHFAYYFQPSSNNIPIFYPFIWFLQTFLVGIILAMITIRKRWIFPVIFAHLVNNIISANALWHYINGDGYEIMTFTVYIPLIVIGIILFVWQFSRIKESLSIGFRDLGEYFKNDASIKESTSNKIERILLDFLFGLIIFLIGVIIL